MLVTMVPFLMTLLQDRMVLNQDRMVVNQDLIRLSPLVASEASLMDNHNGAPTQDIKFTDLVDSLITVDTTVVDSLPPSPGQLSRILRQSRCQMSPKSPS